MRVTPRSLLTPGKDPVSIVQEVGWAPGPVWTGAENLAPTEIRSPDRPARSQLLYRLRYPTHVYVIRPSEFTVFRKSDVFFHNLSLYQTAYTVASLVRSLPPPNQTQ